MANTIKLGTNGTWATKEGSLLAYNDENNNFKPLPFTTTRASSATVVNKQGLIETVGSGIPRIDFSDDANGALLLEPTATNLVTYSEDFSQWSISRGTLGSNITAPNGNADGRSLIANTVNDDHYVTTNASVINTTTYTYSAYLKKGNKNWARLWNTSVGYADFDLENGVVGTQSSAVGSIELFGNGWYRCSIVYTAISTGSDSHRIYTLEGDNDKAFSGDSVTINLYVFGAQLEQNSYSTSYIKTVGTAQTRVADTATGSGNSTVINSTEGVLYAEMSALANNSESRIIQINNSSDTSTFALIKYGAPTNRVECQYRTSGYSLQASLFKDLTDSTESIKIAFKWQLNNFALYINGVKISEDLNGNVSPSNTFNNLLFDNFYGKTKSLQVYTTALSDAELTSLTTI